MAAPFILTSKIPVTRMANTPSRSLTAARARKKEWDISTQILHPDKSVLDLYNAVAPPLYQTATFEQPSGTEGGPYDYTRSGNPTRTLLEEQIAQLEGGCKGYAFASGMAALATCCRLLKPGETILAGDDIYGGTSRLLANVVPNMGVNVVHVDTTDITAVEKCIRQSKPKMVMLESPTNPRMQVCDIPQISEVAHSVGALVVVDNSILTPVFSKPLDLGADICMTSATKFIAGHSDVTGGTLAVKDPELGDRIYFLQNAEGSHLAPFECWLAMRGLKTMSLRMERQAANCARLAEFLSKHPLVKKLNYPGLESNPGYKTNLKQASSGGSLLSFTTGSLDASKIIVEETNLFKITVSFGSVVSLISLPCFMSHAAVPAEVREARGLPDDLIRISAGIEAAEDLLDDLDQAMAKAMAVLESRSVA